MARDYAAIAMDYAQRVTSGRKLVCKEVKQACQRHLDDLERQGTPSFPYVFDPAKGGEICEFAELFTIFEGPLAGQPVKLMDWQCFLYMSLFGWLRQGTKKRRFRRAYVCMPRGNSKSMTAAIMALYMLGADGEGGAQVLSAGATKTISDISFKAAQNLLNACPEMAEAMGLVVQSLTITQPRKASRFWATPAKISASDGKNVHLCVFDELHSLKDRALYDSLKTAMGKRDNNLFLMITTAGVDIATVCYEQHEYIQGILDKSHVEETTFGIIYTLPEGMDWRDPIGWEAANPGWGITVMPDMIEAECNQSIATPSAQNNFRTKYLCQWANAAGEWMDMEKWNKARDLNMRLEQFEGKKCIIGLDLASKVDIAAKVYLFWKEIDGVKHFYAFPTAYVPQAAIDSGKNAKYSGWSIDGHLTVHDGEEIDIVDGIIPDCMNDADRFAVAEFAYDPYKAGVVAQALMKAGHNVCEVRQNTSNLSEPLKELQALVYSGRFHHNSPVYDWCASNVEVKEDINGNIFPRKAGLRRENKIDLISATLNALARALYYDESVVDQTVYVFDMNTGKVFA